MGKGNKDKLLFGIYAVDDLESDIAVSVNVSSEQELKQLIGGLVEFALDSEMFTNILSTAILCIESCNADKQDTKRLNS